MNYKQTSVAGERWNRFNRLEIANPLGGVATISISEQSVLELGGGERVIQDLGSLFAIYDPDEVFPLLDQATGAETGRTVATRDVYAYLQSYAIHRGKQRDAALQEMLKSHGAS